MVVFTSADEEGVHSWNFGDSNTSTFPSPNHTYTLEGTYTVTHTVTNDCGSETETMTVVIDDCLTVCNCQPGQGTPIVLGSGETTLSSLGLPFTVYNTCFEVPPFAKLIIDQSKFIYGSSFVMGEGAEIEIQSNHDLGLLSTKLTGCTNLWKGITLEENAHLGMNYSTIMDAQYAIRIDSEADIYLNTNLFDKNEVGIYVRPSTNQTTYLLNGNFFLNGNTFRGSGDLLPEYTGQDTDINLVAHIPCGIWADQTAMVFGYIGDNIYPNEFKDLRLGIGADRSLISVQNASFDFANSSALYTTLGIFALNSILFADDNVLNDCSLGIITDGSWVRAVNNQVNNGIGISIKSAVIDVTIEDNILSNCAIQVQAPSFALHPSVKNNIITNGSIWVSFSPGGNASGGNLSGFGEVSGNTITTSSSAGVRLDQSNNLRVYDNTITIEGTSNFLTGMIINQSHNLRLRNNTINTATSVVSVYGIRVIASFNNHYCCNTLNNGLYHGMQFTGICAPSHIKHTNFHDSHYGLYCADGTVLGEQTHNGNLWLGTYGSPFGNGARHLGTQQEREDSGFFVEGNIPTFPLWPGTNSNPGWFFPSQGNALNCLTDNSCYSPIFPVGLIGENPDDLLIKNIDIRAATSGYTTSPYSDMLNWETGKYLLRRVNTHPELLGQHTDVDNFYYFSNGISEMDKLVNVENQMESLSTLSQSSWDQIELTENSLTTLLDQVHAIDSLYLISADPLEQNSLIELREIALQDMIDVYLPTRILLDSLELEKMALIEDVETLNNSVTASSIFESNDQLVNRVYLQTVARGILTLDSTQFVTISNIAHQCAMEGGHSVYTARSLYNLNEVKTLMMKCFVIKQTKKKVKVKSNL